MSEPEEFYEEEVARSNTSPPRKLAIVLAVFLTLAAIVAAVETYHILALQDPRIADLTSKLSQNQSRLEEAETEIIRLREVLENPFPIEIVGVVNTTAAPANATLVLNLTVTVAAEIEVSLHYEIETAAMGGSSRSNSRGTLPSR